MLYRDPPEPVWADDVDRRVQFGIDSGKSPSLSLADDPDRLSRVPECPPTPPTSLASPLTPNFVELPPRNLLWKHRDLVVRDLLWEVWKSWASHPGREVDPTIAWRVDKAHCALRTEAEGKGAGVSVFSCT